MDFIDFLSTLSNTLEEIEVHGRNNIDKMYACFFAIDRMKSSLINAIEQAKKEEEKPKEDPIDGGDGDG